MKLFPFALLSPFRKYSTKIAPFASNNHINKPKNAKTKTPRTYKDNKIEWTDQQLQVLDAVERGKNVFMTGPAGTGKTKLIEHIINLLKKIHGKEGVFVTASTGIAACALRGQTLHSFAGIGLAEGDADNLLSRVLSDKMVLKRWKKMEALVIDEISMVDGNLFDKLDYIARHVMGSENEYWVDVPWGGKQVVVSGDFFQLPPVTVDKNLDGKFAFEADSWDSTFDLLVELKTVFRQSNPEHIRLLHGIRRGELDSKGVELLKPCFCASDPDEQIVRLFPRTEDVSKVNQMRLHCLREEIIVYRAFDKGEVSGMFHLNKGIAPSSLELCKGARVMLTKNLDVKLKLVNGATGTIVGFREVFKGHVLKLHGNDKHGLLPIVKFDSGCVVEIKPNKWEVVEGDKIIAKRLQLPLVLAWAISIHKSQGMTLDRLHTDLSRAFGYGMVYVALSRVRSLEGLYLSGFNSSKVKAHAKVLAFYRKLSNEQ